jgi:hypothetical protein
MPTTTVLSPAILALVLDWYGPIPETATEAELREVVRYCGQLRLLDNPPDLNGKAAKTFLCCKDTKLRELRMTKAITTVKTGSADQSARLFSPFSLFAFKLRCLFGPSHKVAAE